MILVILLYKPKLVNNFLAMIGSCNGDPEIDTRIVLPIFASNTGANPIVVLMMELSLLPLSVTPKCNGYLIVLAASKYNLVVSCGSDDLKETTISLNFQDSNNLIYFLASLIIVFVLAHEPVLNPIRIAVLYFLAVSTICFNCILLEILPGLILIFLTPANIAPIANW